MSIDLVQKFLVEVDSMRLLKKFLRLAIPTTLNSYEELAIKIVDIPNPESIGNFYPSSAKEDARLPVILISGWYQKGDSMNSYFNGDGPWAVIRSVKGKEENLTIGIQRVESIIQTYGRAWGKYFTETFGDGYNDCFNEYDGSISLGYRIASCECFPAQLAISIVHIYYGK